MPVFVALLRAVNVGGYGKLPMADFRSLLEKLEYARVQTYIQSGNAVFEARGTSASVARDLALALEKHTGAPVGVMVRTEADLSRVIAGNPFAHEAAADGARVHVVFLERPAPAGAAEGLQAIVEKYPARRDRFALAGDTLYLHLPEGAADSKFTGKPMDRALGGVAGTARNWNTVVKLHAMARAAAG